jgi:hypothetical protein
MIELYAVLDRTNMTARRSIGRLRDGKTHVFDNEGAANRRRSQLANRYPDAVFAILRTTVAHDGYVTSEWI